MENDEIKIFINKFKIFFLCLGALLFVYLGLLMLMEDSFLINIFGIISIMFFGYGVIKFSLELLSKSPKLIINEIGIFEYSIGMILWTDINDISITHASRQKFITVHVKNPNKYMKKLNMFEKFFANLNNVFYQSPIHISSTGLDIDFNELHSIIEKKFKLHRKPNKYEETNNLP